MKMPRFIAILGTTLFIATSACCGATLKAGPGVSITIDSSGAYVFTNTSQGVAGPQGPAGPAGPAGAAGAQGPAGAGCNWVTTTLSGTSHPVVAADSCHQLVYDNTVAGTATFQNPSAMGAGFSVCFLIYNAALTLNPASGASFTFKPAATPTTLNAGDEACLQPDDKGNWSIAVGNILSIVPGP